jgi:Na+/H+ antiporter NhaD/arsenite permease-like protein
MFGSKVALLGCATAVLVLVWLSTTLCLAAGASHTGGETPEFPLMLTSTILTSFNDNAAITYLSTLVPGFTDSLKYAVVAGAVAGGGLTVIANAPNPAGQSILNRHFEGGITPFGLLKAAIIPTVILFVLFFLLP